MLRKTPRLTRVLLLTILLAVFSTPVFGLLVAIKNTQYWRDRCDLYDGTVVTSTSGNTYCYWPEAAPPSDDQIVQETTSSSHQLADNVSVSLGGNEYLQSSGKETVSRCTTSAADGISHTAQLGIEARGSLTHYRDTADGSEALDKQTFFSDLRFDFESSVLGASTAELDVSYEIQGQTALALDGFDASETVDTMLLELEASGGDPAVLDTTAEGITGGVLESAEVDSVTFSILQSQIRTWIRASLEEIAGLGK